MTGGMGDSDAPATYLYTSIVFLILAIVFYLISATCMFMLLAGAMICFIYTFIARADADWHNQTSKNNCPRCKNFNKASIWDN